MNPLSFAQPIFFDKNFQNTVVNHNTPQSYSSSSPEFQAMQQRMQAIRMMQLRALYIQRMQQAKNLKEDVDIKREIIPKQEIPLKEEKFLKLECSSNTEVSPISSVPEPTESAAIPDAVKRAVERSYIQLSLRDQVNFNAYLLKELEKIVRFIITNMGRMTQQTMENSRTQITDNPALLQIFDKLVMKYYSAKKCKEDIVRYILRKAFKVMKTEIGKEQKVCGKQATLLLCKRYFPANFDRIEEAKIKIKDGDELLEFMMPYRKNSKNKTMNNSFVSEIFSSESFCREYQKFLKGFYEIIKEDNDKKIDKLITFLAECVKKDCVSKLGSFSRLPWLEVWMEDTNNVAASLLPQWNQPHPHKKEEF